MENEEDEYLSEPERDREFFGLLGDLFEKNEERYLAQAKLLIKQGSLETVFEGVSIRYKMDRVGCTAQFTKLIESVSSESWNRLGRSKTSRLRELPFIFAGTEASAIFPESFSSEYSDELDSNLIPEDESISDTEENFESDLAWSAYVPVPDTFGARIIFLSRHYLSSNLFLRRLIYWFRRK